MIDVAVIHVDSHTMVVDQPGGAQDHQVLRDGCLTLPEDGTQMADTGVVLAQDRHDAQPRRVSQGPQDPRVFVPILHIRHLEYFTIYNATNPV